MSDEEFLNKIREYKKFMEAENDVSDKEQRQVLGPDGNCETLDSEREAISD